MRQLSVYLSGQLAGELTQDDSGLLGFAYDESWLGNPNAVPLSRSLPLQPEPFQGKKARPFFAGLLPEQDPRQRIAGILGISAKNDFAMLEQIGGECAGAVCLLPKGAPPPPCESRLRKLSDSELRDVIAQLHRRPLLADDKELRLSLAGAQDKLPIVIRDGQVALPLGNTPSTHIIKPEPERFKGLVTNELFCMRLASAVGLSAPAVEALVIGDTPCITVQRYDRRIGPGAETLRIHQEDFCQALGFPPERKYQQEGGPLLRDCVTLLREWSTTPVLDIRTFIDGLIFNVLIGNADAHGKNYSLLYEGGSRRLAPFYDLVCTLAWPELSQKLSMKIGKGKTLTEIAPTHFQGMAGETGLGAPMVLERVSILCHAVLEALAHTKVQSGIPDTPALNAVADVIQERSERLLRLAP